MSTKIDILIPTCKTFNQIQSQIEEIERNTPEPHRIIVTCLETSAAINRNFAHANAESDIVVMLDDDITGFYPNWLSDLIRPLYYSEVIKLVSARYLKIDGKTLAHTMSGNYSLSEDCVFVDKSPTACFVYRKKELDALVGFHTKSSLPFDEKFLGSGWEDDALCWDLLKRFPHTKFVINNKCKLVHINEMKNQHENNTFEINKTYFNTTRGWHVP